MARAATQLRISQPAISKSIAKLEQELGVSLFERSRRGVEPTVYGNALLRRGPMVFDEVYQIAQEIAFLTEPGVGELRIGCPEWVAGGLLSEVIDRISTDHPKLVLHVNSRPAAMEFRDLRSRSVDVEIGRLADDFAQPDLETEILYQEQLVVVTGMSSKWAARRKVALADLMGERWILMPPGGVIMSLVTEAFERGGLAVPPPAIVTYSVHVRNRLIPTGKFLTVIPVSLYRAIGRQIRIKALPIDLPIQPRPVALVTLRNRPLSPAFNLFRDYIRTVARPLSVSGAGAARQQTRTDRETP